MYLIFFKIYRFNFFRSFFKHWTVLFTGILIVCNFIAYILKSECQVNALRAFVFVFEQESYWYPSLWVLCRNRSIAWG